MERNPASPNVRAYPKEKKYIQSIREIGEIEPMIIRRLCEFHEKITNHAKGKKK